MSNIYILIILSLLLFSCNNKKKNDQSYVFDSTQVLMDTDKIQEPEKVRNPDEYDRFIDFPGGQDSLDSFIYKHLIIPEEYKNGSEDSIKLNKHGIVIVSAKVDETGKIIQKFIFGKLTPSTEKEALRIVNILPPFIPAQRDGENVVSYAHIIVDFNGK